MDLQTGITKQDIDKTSPKGHERFEDLVGSDQSRNAMPKTPRITPAHATAGIPGKTAARYHCGELGLIAKTKPRTGTAAQIDSNHVLLRSAAPVRIVRAFLPNRTSVWIAYARSTTSAARAYAGNAANGASIPKYYVGAGNQLRLAARTSM